MDTKSRDYYSYINSPEWRKTRDEAIDYHGEHCARCGAEPGEKDMDGWVRLEVHHKTYARLGAEKMEDLEVLCRSCHAEEHEH